MAMKTGDKKDFNFPPQEYPQNKSYLGKCFAHGFDTRELANIFGVPEWQVYNDLAEARKANREKVA